MQEWVRYRYLIDTIRIHTQGDDQLSSLSPLGVTIFSGEELRAQCGRQLAKTGNPGSCYAPSHRTKYGGVKWELCIVDLFDNRFFFCGNCTLLFPDISSMGKDKITVVGHPEPAR